VHASVIFYIEISYMSEGGIKAKVINRQMLNDTIMEFTIETYQEMNVIPGQWALFLFEDEQWTFQRSYSIIDHDTDNERTMLIFAIKLIENGRASTVFKNTHIGDEVMIRWIFGNFAIQNTQLPKVFIWTWVGIAPLLNMAKYCTTKKQLFFSVSYKTDLFYEDRIKKIHDLEYTMYLSRENTISEQQSRLAHYSAGRIDLTKHHFDHDTEFYVCGRPEVMENIISSLTLLWYTRIYTEKI